MKNYKDILKWIKEEYPNILLMDGYDDCIIGVCERFGQEPIIAYDKEKVINKLQTIGMDYDEAIEWYEFNQLGAWMGDSTPCFIINNNQLDDKIIDNIREEIRSWFNCNDDLSHRECDILNSIVKCYKKEFARGKKL